MIKRNEFGILSVNFLGMEFSFRRSPKPVKPWGISQSEWRKIFDQDLIASIGDSSGLIDDISVGNLKSQENRLLAEKKLREEGIFILKTDSTTNFSLFDELRIETEQLLVKHHQSILSGAEYDDDGLMITAKAADYQQLANSPKTTINIRGKESAWDQGMIDIFNPHLVLKNSFTPIANFVESLQLCEIADSVIPGKWQVQNTNIYVNKGVENTRGFHVDDYGFSSLKVFVYLTDVFRMNDGPYCFIRGSHNSGNLFEKLNRSIARLLGGNIWDVFVADKKKIAPLLGKRGTIIVSNQSGAHRGFPQAPDGNRMLAVFHLHKDH